MYNSILFLHIVGVIVWLGGALALTVFHLLLAHESPGVVHSSFSMTSSVYGRKILGPAVGLTLLSGIALIGISGWIMPLWAVWGLCGLLISWFLGAVLVSRTAQAVAQLAGRGAAEAEILRLGMLRRRLNLLSTIDLLVLLSVVWAMVFKPVA